MSCEDYFKGKVAIVTGSSSGIGRATARMLAIRGARVVIIGRPDAKIVADSVEDAKSEITAAGAKEEDILTIVADLRDPEEPRRIVNETIEKFGEIDILINSAGFVATAVKGIDCPIEHFDTMMNIHCKAVVLLVQAATPHLIESRGVIVNVSSMVAYPFMSHIHAYYGAAKAAQDHLTIQMAGHLIKAGVRVNAVLPGIVATNIAAASGFKSMGNTLLDNPNCFPNGRIATAEEVASVIIFLADSSQSGYVNGARIPVDGGAHLMNVQLAFERK